MDEFLNKELDEGENLLVLGDLNGWIQNQNKGTDERVMWMEADERVMRMKEGMRNRNMERIIDVYKNYCV